jgi:parallel beta-helix repeat protein
MKMKWMARSGFVWKLIAIIALTILFCAAFTASVVSAEDIYVGPNETYETIQGAVNDARPGDTIIVRNGTYTENVMVATDRLTIRSEHGAASTIVQSPKSSLDGFFVWYGRSVTISGFTVSGATVDPAAGISLHVSDCDISNNTVRDNYCGIKLYQAHWNTLTDNDVSNNSFGIAILDWANHNSLVDNTASSNLYGIYQDESWGTHFEGNTASRNNYGIYLQNSLNNHL